MVHLLSIYDNNILGDINNYSIVLDNEKLQEMYLDIYSLYSFEIGQIEIVLELIFKNEYYNEVLKNTNVLADDYDTIKKLASEEKNYSTLNKFLCENNSTSINYDLNSYFNDNIPENLSTEYIFSSSTIDSFLYCIVKEFITNLKNIKFECCKNCGYWFMHTKSKEQKYCNDIYENNMTCFEIAKEERSKKIEKDDIYLQKCRKRYKNLHKQISIGASETVQKLFERLKKEFPIYQEKYKDGTITGEELIEWLEGMKIRK